MSEQNPRFPSPGSDAPRPARDQAAVGLQIHSRCADAAAVKRRYGPELAKGALFVRTRHPRAIGTPVRFVLRHSAGGVALNGIARVESLSRDPLDPGMRLQLLGLDATSHAYLAEIGLRVNVPSLRLRRASAASAPAAPPPGHNPERTLPPTEFPFIPSELGLDLQGNPEPARNPPRARTSRTSQSPQSSQSPRSPRIPAPDLEFRSEAELSRAAAPSRKTGARHDVRTERTPFLWAPPGQASVASTSVPELSKRLPSPSPGSSGFSAGLTAGVSPSSPVELPELPEPLDFEFPSEADLPGAELPNDAPASPPVEPHADPVDDIPISFDDPSDTDSLENVATSSASTSSAAVSSSAAPSKTGSPERPSIPQPVIDGVETSLPPLDDLFALPGDDDAGAHEALVAKLAEQIRAELEAVERAKLQGSSAADENGSETAATTETETVAESAPVSPQTEEVDPAPETIPVDVPPLTVGVTGTQETTGPVSPLGEMLSAMLVAAEPIELAEAYAPVSDGGSEADPDGEVASEPPASESPANERTPSLSAPAPEEALDSDSVEDESEGAFSPAGAVTNDSELIDSENTDSDSLESGPSEAALPEAAPTASSTDAVSSAASESSLPETYLGELPDERHEPVAGAVVEEADVEEADATLLDDSEPESLDSETESLESEPESLESVSLEPPSTEGDESSGGSTEESAVESPEETPDETPNDSTGATSFEDDLSALESVAAEAESVEARDAEPMLSNSVFDETIHDKPIDDEPVSSASEADDEEETAVSDADASEPQSLEPEPMTSPASKAPPEPHAPAAEQESESEPETDPATESEVESEAESDSGPESETASESSKPERRGFWRRLLG